METGLVKKLEVVEGELFDKDSVTPNTLSLIVGDYSPNSVIGHISNNDLFPKDTPKPEIGQKYYLGLSGTKHLGVFSGDYNLQTGRFNKIYVWKEDSLGYLGDEIAQFGCGHISGYKEISNKGTLNGFMVQLKELPGVAFPFGIRGFPGDDKQKKLEEKYKGTELKPTHPTNFDKFLADIRSYFD